MKKYTGGGVTIADFKLHCRAIVVKPAWHQNKSRHSDQWKSTEEPGIITHTTP